MIPLMHHMGGSFMLLGCFPFAGTDKYCMDGATLRVFLDEDLFVTLRHSSLGRKSTLLHNIAENTCISMLRWKDLD